MKFDDLHFASLCLDFGITSVAYNKINKLDFISIFRRRLTFETDRKLQRALNFSPYRNLHILELISFFMDWLEYVFVMLRDMYWACSYSIEAPCNIIYIHNTHDDDIERAQPVANYHDAILKLLIAIDLIFSCNKSKCWQLHYHMFAFGAT
ncbi:hypothetical protein TSUD_174370 [Trifolium subterraneum]|uniref:Uncharacterized protein n=1 Tax=Trifolium subterraneum TaxID=3900 RepID=A0A2Z6NQF2_TRISU|nr:hypothetical protein TSUD_174370 [Trifolium subterraneum]